ncbi:MAG TPA: hypothetical protein VH092_08315 [Urbifossiella sp.]|nr:hypothetical protein [Urbifossiella sp.]
MTVPPADATRFLRSLTGYGFTPPEAGVAALAAAGAAVPVAAGLAALRFEQEVGRFAAAFWGLAPADRTARWTALAAAAVGPAAARLHELGPGLEVVPAGHADPAAAGVAALVGELFVLPARARAVRRLQWLTDAVPRLVARTRAARAVLRDDMPLARLEPQLFDWLAGGDPPVRVEGRSGGGDQGERLLGRLAKRQLLFWGVVLGVCFYVWWVAVGKTGPDRRSRSSAPPPPAGQSLAAVEVRVATKHERADRSGSQTGVAGPPVHTDPQDDTSAEEAVRGFLAYEQGGRVGPAPAGYRDWVGAGRPRGAGRR